MILSLCACGNKEEKELSNSTIATINDSETQEVQLGETIKLDFMEIALNNFVIDDNLEVKKDSKTTISLIEETEDMKAIWVKGKIKNLSNHTIGGSLGDDGCIFGSFRFHTDITSYGYEYKMIINNEYDYVIPSLTDGDFYLYAQVPTSIAENFKSCSVSFEFNEDLSVLNVTNSTKFDCEYQYVINDI